MLRYFKYAVLLISLSTGYLFAANKELSDRDYFIIAEQMETDGKIDNANQVFYRLLRSSDEAVSLDSAFKLAQAAMQAERFEDAALYYRWMLQQNPNLPQVRFELALCYMKLGKWQQADYQLRLAMAAPDIPLAMQQIMFQYRYLIRQNKNWNIWFNFGAAPDNNVNNTIGGEECITTPYGILCHQLPEPVSAVGFNLTFGGNYEFKLSDNWRWKSDLNLYSNTYNKHDFDDLYILSGTGPRYVWEDGDVWLAGVIARRWYGWDRYNLSLGGKLDINYDFTRKLSGGLSLRILNNKYDEYGPWMNGQTYSANGRVSYSLDATKYIVLHGGIERNTAKDEVYANWRPNIGAGFGSTLPYGFDIYLESFFYWTYYDGGRWVVDDGNFTKKAVKDFNQRYSVSLSNHKWEVWGFVPVLTISYTRRDSNIWQLEYDKYAAEFTFQQRF